MSMMLECCLNALRMLSMLFGAVRWLLGGCLVVVWWLLGGCCQTAVCMLCGCLSGCCSHAA
eukprot:11160224-Lingulodinium_polyedra.AAC.1